MVGVKWSGVVHIVFEYCLSFPCFTFFSPLVRRSSFRLLDYSPNATHPLYL